MKVRKWGMATRVICDVAGCDYVAYGPCVGCGADLCQEHGEKTWSTRTRFGMHGPTYLCQSCNKTVDISKLSEEVVDSRWNEFLKKSGAMK